MGWMVNITNRPLLPEKETQFPIYRRLGGPHGRSGRMRKISPPHEFDPRTFQPAASAMSTKLSKSVRHYFMELKLVGCAIFRTKIYVCSILML